MCEISHRIRTTKAITVLWTEPLWTLGDKDAAAVSPSGNCDTTSIWPDYRAPPVRSFRFPALVLIIQLKNLSRYIYHLRICRKKWLRSNFFLDRFTCRDAGYKLIYDVINIKTWIYFISKSDIILAILEQLGNISNQISLKKI